MKISRITAIEPDGKAWTPRNSTTPLYPFLVSFADGMKGQANSKSEPPPYAVGDDVGYEQTGTSPRGVPKLKIDRKAAAEGGGDDGGGQRSAPRGTATTARQPAASGSSINGQTVGMAMKEALTLTNMTTLKPDDPEFWKQVHITASDIIRVSLMLEKGKLAPSAKDRADPDGAAKREQDRQAAENARLAEEARLREEKARAAQTRPAPQAEQGNLDEDVPF